MKKRQYTAEYKAKIVLEILREENTVSEIASRVEISAKQLHNWKKEFLENASKVFSSDKTVKEAKREATVQQEEREALPKCSAQTGIKSQVSKGDPLSIKRQCELLGINRTSAYYTPVERSADALEREELIKRRIDYWHTKFSYMGVRKLRDKLQKDDGIKAGRKLIRRLMDDIGIRTVYPKRGIEVTEPGNVKSDKNLTADTTKSANEVTMTSNAQKDAIELPEKNDSARRVAAFLSKTCGIDYGLVKALMRQTQPLQSPQPSRSMLCGQRYPAAVTAA